MAEADRQRWNERYRAREYDFTPNRWLVSLADRIRSPREGALALDVACGGGRNALFLAELGYVVDAWDVSDEGLTILTTELARRAAGRQPHVKPARIDLEAAAVPTSRYDLVVDLFYLERPLLPGLAAALRPGGLLAFETFVDLGDGRHPEIRPAFKLRPGELPAVYADLDLLEYTEDEQSGTARLLARRPARPNLPSRPSVSS
jgi:tellurite methyltransferase